MDLHRLAASVLTSAAWGMRGVTPAALNVGVAKGEFIRLHRGAFIDRATWKAQFTEGRHAARAIAVARAMRDGDLVLSHTSAAVVHGLPLYRYEAKRVHLTGPRASGSTRASDDVARHRASVEGDRMVIAGLEVTSLARTVADVIGHLPLEAAVALADAALRKVAWLGGDHPYDAEADACFRADVAACSALTRGARGSVQARWVLAFADGRAQLPGESVSRLYLHQLGFAAPRVQVRIPHDTGYYEVDFGLDDVETWGEFDGEGKYTDEGMLRGSTPAAVVFEEKHREDDIRGRTGWRMVRWGSPHIGTRERFRRKLSAFGIHPRAAAVTAPPTFAGRTL
ncbi:hypothetical protein [Microbacterium hominis]|uniref:Transcriptional regulator, AbiEi antitoxin, Type IV TA system n=1 Tax=Microbacterium hominis TaxID=162426 RepID=A0A7D4Q954_9MICO|nr:hypothetical protein [Microbacterium hominis]QKJ20319.1 hypothetical protein HQM25_13755 [Microbacterium hominis]